MPDADGAARAAAGWYPDPFERARLRFWDGDRWTEYADDGHGVTWDAQPLAALVPTRPGLPGFGAVLVGVSVGFGLAIAIVALLHAHDDPGGQPALLGLSEIGLWAGLVGACVYVSRTRGTGSLVRDFDLRFRWIDVGLGVAGALVGRLVAALVLAPIPIFPSRKLTDIDRSILQQGSRGAALWIVLVLVTCVGAPLIEELFFRGLLQTRLVGRFGPVVGIGLTSLLFGAAHLSNWQGWVTLAYGWSIAGGGLVLGTLRYTSGRLGTSILAHAMFNGIAIAALAALT